MRISPMMLAMTVAGAAFAMLPSGEPPQTSPAEQSKEQTPAGTRYPQAKENARQWLDRLTYDHAELRAKDIGAIKKLAELLDAYLVLYQREDDAQVRQAIMNRVRVLAAVTDSPQYHEIAEYPEDDFDRNSMSYLRSAWLMDQFGLDTAVYRQRIRELKTRLDNHLERRGAWQRIMFHHYYEHFGLAKPALLEHENYRSRTVLGRKRPYEQIQEQHAYELTHVVYAAFDYGRRPQSDLTAAELDYLREVLPALTREYIAYRNPDLVGELLSCLLYLGWRNDPAAAQAVAYLETSQNANGSWGDYELLRMQYDRFVDHAYYLHTTFVALRGLAEFHEGTDAEIGVEAEPVAP